MGNFAKGKHALAISDRSGFAFPYREMLREWNGSFVHKTEYEAKQPQLEPKVHSGDPQALQNSRPDRVESIVPVLLNKDSFTTGNANSSTITVTEINHGRLSSDTVRFRNVLGFDGILASNLNKAAGYSITKVNDDSYTFSVDTNTAATGKTKGGGGDASAGPATITA